MRRHTAMDVTVSNVAVLVSRSVLIVRGDR